MAQKCANLTSKNFGLVEYKIERTQTSLRDPPRNKNISENVWR